jgi:uncharacterized protein YodC (DUF2158 family)
MKTAAAKITLGWTKPLTASNDVPISKPSKALIRIMAKKKFKTGDDVRLKSGGPQMTVVGYTEKGQTECCWFDDDKKERRTQFPEAALVLTPAAELSDDQLRAEMQNILLQHDSKTRQHKKANKNN